MCITICLGLVVFFRILYMTLNSLISKSDSCPDFGNIKQLPNEVLNKRRRDPGPDKSEDPNDSDAIFGLIDSKEGGLPSSQNNLLHQSHHSSGWYFQNLGKEYLSKS